MHEDEQWIRHYDATIATLRQGIADIRAEAERAIAHEESRIGYLEARKRRCERAMAMLAAVAAE